MHERRPPDTTGETPRRSDEGAPPAPGGPRPEREQDLEHKTDREAGHHD
jgi:hypothetical protein